MSSDEKRAYARPRRVQRPNRSVATPGPVLAGWAPSSKRPGIFADRHYCPTCTAKKIDGRCPRCER